MKALYALALAAVLFSCKKNKDKEEENIDYRVEYSVALTGNAKIDTLIYINEDGNTVSLIGPDAPKNFQRSFKRTKGFHSYLKIAGKFSGDGRILFRHRVTAPDGKTSYDMHKENENKMGGSYQYRVLGDFTIK